MDYLAAHKKAQRDMSLLYARMRADQALVTNVDYVMRGRKMMDGTQPAIKNVVNMSMNRPQVFASYVEAALRRSDEKVYTVSDDEKIDTDELEDFTRALYETANMRRRDNGLFDIEPVVDQQHCRRGRSALKVLCQMIDGQLVIDMATWDTCYTTIGMGYGGLDWAGYEVIKPKAAIEQEAWARKVEFKLKDKDRAKVLEILTREGNIIYVDDVKVYEQEYPKGWDFVPLCYEVVPIGSMMVDEGNILFEGESIFFMIRHLIPEFNRLCSILQTKNMESVLAPMQQVVATPDGEASDYDEVTAPGANTPVPVANAIHPIHFEDIKRSAILLLNEINSALDAGSLSRIMLGELPGELSAVALLQIEQGQGQVYMPRLTSRGSLKKRGVELATRQIIAMGESSISLGTKGHQRTFKTASLDGEYDTGFVYSNKSPETDYARLSLGKSYIGILDELTILDEILKRDDPQGDLNRLNRQRLREISPMLRVYDGLMSLAEIYEKGDESVRDEIDIVKAELGVSLNELKAGRLPQGGGIREPGRDGEALQIMGGERSSAKKAADLERSLVSEE